MVQIQRQALEDVRRAGAERNAQALAAHQRAGDTARIVKFSPYLRGLSNGNFQGFASFALTSALLWLVIC